MHECNTAPVVIAQWESECISLSVLPVARVQLPTMAEYYKGFSLADHMCCLLHSSGIRFNERSGAPFSLMKSMRGLRINLVYGEQKNYLTSSTTRIDAPPDNEACC